MFSVLRLIVIIVVALIVFGWAVVAAEDQPEAGRLQPGIVLQGMPDLPLRKETKRTVKYRTPFIVPISPPDFGNIQGPAAVPTDEVTVHRPIARPDEMLEPMELSSAIQLPQHENALARALDQLSIPLVSASRIVTKHVTQSKVVSVTAPNTQLLAERITQHNLSVSAAADQLRTQEFWTLDELQSMIAQLKAQHSASQLLSMYWRLLEPRDQWRVGRLTLLAANAELFRQRLFETQVALDINPQAITSLERKVAESQLQTLADQIDLLSK